jgi:hypothetical protein
MKTSRTWRDITLFLAVCAGVFCACFAVVSVANEHHTARYRVDMHKSDLAGWEACRQTDPNLFRENEQAVSRCAKSLAKAEDSFWARLSTQKLIAIYAVAGFVGAVVGFAAIWLTARSIAMALTPLTRPQTNSPCAGNRPIPNN